MKTADKEKLWDAYRQKKTQEIREQLIIEYAQLVKQQSLDTVDVKATA